MAQVPPGVAGRDASLLFPAPAKYHGIGLPGDATPKFQVYGVNPFAHLNSLLLIFSKQLGTIMAIYAQSSGSQYTNSASFVAIPGLSVSIPEGVGTAALVILNVPNPYATGNNTPGGTFGISVNGTVSPVQATFTYNEVAPTNTGRAGKQTFKLIRAATSQQNSRTKNQKRLGRQGRVAMPTRVMAGRFDGRDGPSYSRPYVKLQTIVK